MFTPKTAETEGTIATDWTSRKYRTAWMLTWLFTILFALPPIIGYVLTSLGLARTAFTLLSVDYYVPFLMALWFVYFGANVTEKAKIFSPKLVPAPAEITIECTEEPTGISVPASEDRGGQPDETDNV